jgi:hypothetical protein
MQLCVWSIDGWEKKKARFIQAPPNRAAGPLVGDTRVQFHNDQAHLLVVHESQISIYDSKLDCLRSVSSASILSPYKTNSFQLVLFIDEIYCSGPHEMLSQLQYRVPYIRVIVFWCMQASVMVQLVSLKLTPSGSGAALPLPLICPLQCQGKF